MGQEFQPAGRVRQWLGLGCWRCQPCCSGWM